MSEWPKWLKVLTICVGLLVIVVQIPGLIAGSAVNIVLAVAVAVVLFAMVSKWRQPVKK